MPRCLTIALSVLAFPAVWEPLAAQVRFNRDVRPILSDRCFACHGPDAKNKNIPLRLDSFEAATAVLRGGRRAITPGDTAASQLIARIVSPVKGLRMPPAASGPPLSAAEVETLRQWVAQGAQWEKHWAYLPPERPARPKSA